MPHDGSNHSATVRAALRYRIHRFRSRGGKYCCRLSSDLQPRHAQPHPHTHTPTRARTRTRTDTSARAINQRQYNETFGEHRRPFRHQTHRQGRSSHDRSVWMSCRPTSSSTHAWVSITTQDDLHTREGADSGQIVATRNPGIECDHPATGRSLVKSLTSRRVPGRKIVWAKGWLMFAHI